MNEFYLDKTDIAILGYLRKDGRMSFTDISNLMGVSVGMIRNRYQRLVENNVLHIIGWTDPARTGFNAYARVMVTVRPSELIRTVANDLQKIETVSFLAITTGQYDLEINLICKDNDQLMSVLHDQIHKIKGVYETSTTIYLEVMKWASHEFNPKIRTLQSAEELTLREKNS